MRRRVLVPEMYDLVDALSERDRLVRDLFGDRWSTMTFLIYLDGEYDGGETTFIRVVRKVLGFNAYLSIFFGMVMTICVQSSSITTTPAEEATWICRGHVSELSRSCLGRV